MAKCIQLLIVIALSSSMLSAQEFIDGLVAYYPFSGNAIDESGNQHQDGIIYQAVPTSDRFGIENSAYYFNGSNSYINLGKNPDLLPVSFTYSVWIYPISYTDIMARVIQKANRKLTAGFSVEFDAKYDDGIYKDRRSDDKTVFGVFFQEPTNENNGLIFKTFPRKSITKLNEWYHVVFSYDNTYHEVKFYVNGVLQEQGDFLFNYIDALDYDFIIGGYHDYRPKDKTNNKAYFHGKIDDLLIYNRALSEQEILMLYYSNNRALDEQELHREQQTYEILYSHNTSDELWPFEARSLEVTTVDVGSLSIRSSTSLWRHVSITGGRITNALRLKDGDYIIPPYFEMQVEPYSNNKVITIKTDWNYPGVIGLINAFDFVFTACFGTRLPSNMLEADEFLTEQISEEIAGGNMYTRWSSIFFSFKDFVDVMRDHNATETQKIESLLTVVNSFVNSAKMRQIFALYRRMGAKAGLQVTPESVRGMSKQIEFLLQLLNTATFAYDVRKTPRLETVSVFFR